MTELLPLNTMAQVFLRGQALEAGYTDRVIAQLVRSKDWHRVRRGAYVSGGVWATLTPEEQHALRARAVLMQARTDVVLSHVSALPEYGAPMWDLDLDTVHVTRRDQRAGRREAGVRQHQGVLLPGDVEVLRGVEVTSATRTAIDVTTVASAESGLAVVNHMLHAKHTTIVSLRDRYASMEHHPYTLRTDLVLRLADPRIESLGESRTLYLFWRQGLPAPEPQFKVFDSSGRLIARLDFAFPERKVWVEFDGREKYLKYLREGETVTDAVLREKRREERISRAHRMALHSDHVGRPRLSGAGGCPDPGRVRLRHRPPLESHHTGSSCTSRPVQCLGCAGIPGSPGIPTRPYTTERFSYGVESTIVVRVETLAAARMRARRSSRCEGVGTRILRM